MSKEISPLTFIIILVVIIAIIIFAYVKFTSKQVKKPPPGVIPVPKAPPGFIIPLTFSPPHNFILLDG